MTWAEKKKFKYTMKKLTKKDTIQQLLSKNLMKMPSSRI